MANNQTSDDLTGRLLGAGGRGGDGGSGSEEASSRSCAASSWWRKKYFLVFLIALLSLGFLIIASFEGFQNKEDVHLKQAQERFFTVWLNHDDDLLQDTFQLRYFWVPPPEPSRSRTIFLYTGNEAAVEAYVKSCGMMWENAKDFNAALVFAEHRFWGKSQPAELRFDLAGPDQALKDFKELLSSLIKNETANGMFKLEDAWEKVYVVAFGGSYGGMLAAWMRLKYPEAVDIAVASSAPILAFPDSRIGRRRNGFYKDNGASYWKVVTHVYSACAHGIHSALKSQKLNTAHARSLLGICDTQSNSERTEADVLTWIGYALETLAMGDYHFASDYITGKMLPARPAALACKRFLGNKQGGLSAIRDAVGVMFNVSNSVKCFNVPNRREASFYDGLWDQYWCRWLIPQETYFQMNGPPNDMFLPLPLNWHDIAQHCNDTLGATPDGGKSVREWFGAISESDWEEKASRIIFANGGHDPWSSGGYFSTKKSTLVPLFIPSGAHHVDLMFSRPEEDPEDVIQARVQTIQHIKSWIKSDLSDRQHEPFVD